jgi:chromosome segregation ATPase
MDSHLYVDQYLRRRKGVAFPSNSVEQQQLSQAAHNAILAAAGLRRASSPPSHQAAPPQQQPVAVAQPAAESHAVNRALAEHADVVSSLASHVATFVDRTDALNLQVQHVEDKILNLTKMLKVAQEVGDEQTQSLSESTELLRRRLDDAVETESRTRNELDDLRRRVPQIVQDAVNQAVVTLRAEMKVEFEAVRGSITAVERQQLVMKNETLTQFGQHMESHVAAKLAHEAEKNTNTLREHYAKVQIDLASLERDIGRSVADRFSSVSNDVRQLQQQVQGISVAQQQHQAQLQQVQQQQQLLQQQPPRREESFVTAETVRRMIDDRSVVIASQARDTAQSDIRQAILSVQTTLRDESLKPVTRLEEDLRDVSGRMRECESQATSIEGSFHEFIAAFKEHTTHQTSKMEDTAASMKELMELHDETRSIVATEIESTKQWATRNMVRLKKHLDNVNVDVGAIKEAHRDLHLLVERMRIAQGDEHARLTDLVSQRTREADALADMVDREIHSVQNIARAYRQGPAHGGGTLFSATAARRAAPAPAAAGRAREDDRSSRDRGTASTTEDDDGAAAPRLGDEDEEVFERFAARTAARRDKMRNLFQEMNFRHTAPITTKDN